MNDLEARVVDLEQVVAELVRLANEQATREPSLEEQHRLKLAAAARTAKGE